MNIEEAELYLEHTSKDDFNLEEHQKENRYQAIQVVLKEIERLNNIIKEAIEYIKKHGDYNKLSGCIEELDLYKINELLEILQGSDKE